MKTVFLVLGAMLVIHSAALANQIANVTVSAAHPSASVQLVDQKFEPIYGQEPYEATCSREVLDHMQTVCHDEFSQVCSGGGEVCENVRDQVCRNNVCTPITRRECHTTPQSCTDVPRRVCTDQAVYRTDFYSCTQYRTVVTGQRLVKTFNHSVEVVLRDTKAIAGADLNVELTAVEGVITPRLTNSLKLGLLNYDIAILSSDDNGATAQAARRIVITAGLPGRLVNQIMTAQLTDLELGHEAAKFKLTNMADLLQNLNLSIKIVRNRAIGGDSILYNGTVSSNQLSLVARNADIQVIVPFEKLQIDSLNSLKHDLHVSVSLNVGNVLNYADFQTALSKKLEADLKKVKPSF
ncbi:MAG: hypothetical protein JST80_12605 [Bdellovibrionales bacterium]|nr:hypothetical protein [Bdellovibrionales bacterium]